MGTNMRKAESKKQISKFKHYILTPVRIVKKAKELYVKGLMACSGRIAGSSAVSHLHAADHTNNKKNNVNTSSKTNNANGTSERQSLRDILRTTTAPINETRFVTNGSVQIGSSGSVVIQRRQRQRIAGYKYNRNKMSYQTEVRKMGRIDEDRPCYFEEDESDHSISKASLVYLYPRSTVVKLPPAVMKPEQV